MNLLIRKFKLYRKWWRTWGTMPVLPWLSAAALYKVGKYEAAIPLYRDGLARYPNHIARTCARLDLAYCLLRTNKFTEAEEELRTACTQAPDSREANMRMAQYLNWMGRSLQAAWCLRKTIKTIGSDAEMAAAFMMAAIEGSAPKYLIREAAEELRKAEHELDETNDRVVRKVRVARACYIMHRGDYDRARSQLARISCDGATCIEAIQAFSELLIEEGKIAFARQQLRRALAVAPNHPRILSLLAETYLKSGQCFNADFATQLATTACQYSDWCSPRELHVLAEAHCVRGDKMSALLMASKAKDAGSRLLGAYSKVQLLNQLIDDLSTGTLA